MSAPSVVNRAAIVDRGFLACVERLRARPAAPSLLSRTAPIRAGTSLTAGTARGLFESMVASRHLDFLARDLKAQGVGYYTIGSAGHEANVVLGELLRLDDWLFLHYRSGALFHRRAGKVPGLDPMRDVALSLCAAQEDPAAGGRHKVFGSLPLRIPPQTSTIASQLPKAVGCATGLERRRRLGLLPPGEPPDSIAVVSMGDAGVNHASALAAINAAAWASFQKLPCPVLFVCEDNGIGISVPSPRGWIEAQYGARAGLVYVPGDGLDLAAAYDAAARAIGVCRTERRPVFLHLETVRLLAHAGSDVETEYHTSEEIAAVEAKDPLLAAAEMLVGAAVMTAEEVRAVYESARQQAQAAGRYAAARPRLSTVEEIVAPLAPARPAAVAVEAQAHRADYQDRRRAMFGGDDNQLPERSPPRTLAALVSAGLADLMAKYPELVLFGEDVGKKGGVYHATANLQKLASRARVFDTLLDETSILGLAIGAAHVGLLPCPEIQYLAYLHNAEDQLRGEACSLSYFSNGQFRNGMVVRVAGLAYQKGFGGHFHNDDAVAVLRDIPGLILGVPARGDDAVEMQRAAFAAAKVDGRVVVLLEPIALYHTKDLHRPGDGEWRAAFPPPGRAAVIGEGRVVLGGAAGAPLSILSYGNGLYLALRAARRLAADFGIGARVCDLRWLAPLDMALCVREAQITGHVLIVDECRRTAGPSEQIVTALVESGVDAQIARVTAVDTYVPLGPAADLVLPSEDGIVEAARELVRGARAAT